MEADDHVTELLPRPGADEDEDEEEEDDFDVGEAPVPMQISAQQSSGNLFVMGNKVSDGMESSNERVYNNLSWL